jgi:ribonuclease HI
MNVDASFHEDNRSGGWGTVCRHNSLDICVDAAGPLRMMSDVMHAEAIALSNAMQVAEHIGIGKVFLETDCLNLKNAMSSSEYSFSTIGILVSDMRFILHMNFLEAKVVYTP